MRCINVELKTRAMMVKKVDAKEKGEWLSNGEKCFLKANLEGQKLIE